MTQKLQSWTSFLAERRDPNGELAVWYDGEVTKRRRSSPGLLTLYSALSPSLRVAMTDEPAADGFLRCTPVGTLAEAAAIRLRMGRDYAHPDLWAPQLRALVGATRPRDVVRALGDVGADVMWGGK